MNFTKANWEAITYRFPHHHSAFQSCDEIFIFSSSNQQRETEYLLFYE